MLFFFVLFYLPPGRRAALLCTECVTALQSVLGKCAPTHKNTVLHHNRQRHGSLAKTTVSQLYCRVWQASYTISMTAHSHYVLWDDLIYSSSVQYAAAVVYKICTWKPIIDPSAQKHISALSLSLQYTPLKHFCSATDNRTSSDSICLVNLHCHSLPR